MDFRIKPILFFLERMKVSFTNLFVSFDQFETNTYQSEEINPSNRQILCPQPAVKRTLLGTMDKILFEANESI